MDVVSGRGRVGVSRRVVTAVAVVAALVLGGAVGVVAQDGGDGGFERESRAGASSPTESAYVPITPCRVVNTATTGARFSAGQTRAFRTQGNTSAQGGAASCGIPSTATALELNMTAASSAGNGYIRVAPAGVAIPNATFMNFTGAFNVSNAGTVRVAAGTGNNLQVRVFNSSTHVIVDVLGYYVADLFAAVNSGGSLHIGNGVTSSTRNGTGIYTVTFNRNIEGCGASVTVFSAAGGGEVVHQVFGSSSVQVRSFSSSGVPADRSFDVSVTC